MARQPRIVVPDVPHHITQRGNRKQKVFFGGEDYAYYKSLLKTFAQRAELKVLAWCLMPNHVHVVAVPKDRDGLRATFGPLNRTYAHAINKREGWSGHLWQSRFASVPLDEAHTIAAIRYVDLNPVRSGMVVSPGEYRWSSAAAHLTGTSDGLTDQEASLVEVDDFPGLLASGLNERQLSTFRQHEINGFPMGSEEFLDKVQYLSGQRVKPLKRGGARFRDQK